MINTYHNYEVEIKQEQICILHLNDSEIFGIACSFAAFSTLQHKDVSFLTPGFGIQSLHIMCFLHDCLDFLHLNH